MSLSNLYVPDPQKWITFFKNKNQIGKGVGIPHKLCLNDSQVSVKAVSPAEQTVDQAKSELKRDDISNLENVSTVHKTFRRHRGRNSKNETGSRKVSVKPSRKKRINKKSFRLKRGKLNDKKSSKQGLKLRSNRNKKISKKKRIIKSSTRIKASDIFNN